jgi:phage gpG-like protein
MAYADDVRRFQIKVTHRVPEVMIGVAQGAFDSIVEGSPLTGAPGQPVDTGFLKNSWQLAFEPDMSAAIIGTNVAYAPAIEYGTRTAFDPKGIVNKYGVEGGRIGPALPRELGGARKHIKSTVGGPRSVQITVANADNIQADVLRQVNG